MAAKTPAQRPLTRKKGHGGKRAGAGRKQERLPEDLLADLGAPPEHPLQKSAWWARLLEVIQYGVLRGKPWVTMLRDARASAIAASKLVPEEIKARAAAIVDQDDREMREDASPSTTERGEDPIARANAGAIRRDPT